MISHLNFYILICPGIIRLALKKEAKEINTRTCEIYAKHMLNFINQIHIRAGRQIFLIEKKKIKNTNSYVDRSSQSSGEDYYFDYAQCTVYNAQLNG